VILVTAIPFGIYDLVEALDNVESAAVAGDSFPTTRVLTADGVVSLIGCCMGNPFINAVYIGHPGWKSMGGRIGYSAATGLTVISLGEIDPRSAAGLAAQPNLRMEEPDFKEVKLRLADGTEIPARIVMKDADLDLAFVAPLPESATSKARHIGDASSPATSGILGRVHARPGARCSKPPSRNRHSMADR